MPPVPVAWPVGVAVARRASVRSFFCLFRLLAALTVFCVLLHLVLHESYVYYLLNCAQFRTVSANLAQQRLPYLYPWMLEVRRVVAISDILFRSLCLPEASAAGIQGPCRLS